MRSSQHRNAHCKRRAPLRHPHARGGRVVPRSPLHCSAAQATARPLPFSTAHCPRRLPSSSRWQGSGRRHLSDRVQYCTEVLVLYSSRGGTGLRGGGSVQPADSLHLLIYRFVRAAAACCQWTCQVFHCRACTAIRIWRRQNRRQVSRILGGKFQIMSTKGGVRASL